MSSLIFTHAKEFIRRQYTMEKKKSPYIFKINQLISVLNVVGFLS